MTLVTQPASFFLKPENSAPTGRPTADGAAADAPWYLDGAEVLLVLRQRLAFVLVPAAALVALALIVYLAIQPQYMATAQVLIDPQGLQVLKDDLKPPAQATDASLLLVDSDMLVLASDDVLRAVVDRFALDRDPDFNPPPNVVERVAGALSNVLGLAGPPVDVKLVTLRALRERLTTQRLERSFVLAVSVTTGSRDLSKRLAQGIAETYLTAEAGSRAEVAARASASLTARLNELKKSVRSAEDEAQAFKTVNNLVGTRTQLVSEQQLGQIGEQIGAARARASEQRSRLDQIEGVLASHGAIGSLPEALQSQTVGLLRVQLAQAERVLADDMVNLGARHPALIAARTQVLAARSQLDGEVQRIAASVRTEYKATLANLAGLQKRLDTDKSEAVSVGGSMVHLRELEQQIETRRNLYGSVLARSRELGEQQQIDSSASRIISPATLPARRKGLPMPIVVAGALGLGLGLGVGAALLADALTRRVRTSRRLRQAFHLPLMGVLPPAGPDEATAGSRPYALAVAHVDDHVATYLQQALVQQGSLQQPSPRVVVVTAADGQSGKELLALRLADAASSGAKRVLLVDADPDDSVVETLGLALQVDSPAVEGGRLLVGDRRLARFPRLGLLDEDRLSPRGDHRAAVDAVFQRACDYDVVVVNAGELGADLFTDRLVVDPRASIVLLAVSAKQSTFGRIERALSRFGARPALACVLTDAYPIDA